MEETDKSSASILNAVASIVRLRILKLLATKGPLSYTEIMFEIKLDPIRDAGKFVYHLKNLINSDLIVVDKRSKKYEVTELGRLIVGFSRDLDEYLAVKKGQMYVRTSRLSIEEFDRSRISSSLVTEAGMPLKLAEEIAAEAEERLIKLKTKYLTAPLIREFINSILIEKRLEEYRHKLTRVGMPLYDVKNLIDNADGLFWDVNSIETQASSTLMEEYVLLNGVSRDVSDAHLSGLIHIDKISSLVLKPDEISHDLQLLFQKGVIDDPPKNLKEALCLLTKVFQMNMLESSGEGLFDEFNVFLAPFVRGMNEDEIGDHLYQFLKNLNVGFHVLRPGISLGLETWIPEFIGEIEAIGPQGKCTDKYKDYAEESSLILKILVQKVKEYVKIKPLFNPRLILKVRRGKDEYKKGIPSKIWPLAKSACSLFFALINKEDRVSYTPSAHRLSNEWSDDWRFDCLRTGNIGTVFLNMPRIAFEAGGNQDRFDRLLEKSIELSVNALMARGYAVKERLRRGALPLISTVKDTPYFLFDNASYTISTVGLHEALSIHHKIDLKKENKLIEASLREVERLNSIIEDIGRKHGLRFTCAQIPSEIVVKRLSRLDLERYGKNINPRGYSSSSPLAPKKETIPLKKYIGVESKFQQVFRGGGLTVISPPHLSNSSFRKIENMVVNSDLFFFTFSGSFTYCRACGRIESKISRVCRKCGSNVVNPFGKPFGILKPIM